MNNIKRNPCRISVIMPACNAGKFVSEAIQSILNQSFPDFEFIIIDDSSTDDTWEIILSFKDNRIIALQNPRKIGQYPTRNRGIQMSKGKYIAMMDADVISFANPAIELNSLEELIKVSEMSPERLATYINTWEWL